MGLPRLEVRPLAMPIFEMFCARRAPLVVLDDPFCALDKEVAKEACATLSLVVSE